MKKAGIIALALPVLERWSLELTRQHADFRSIYLFAHPSDSTDQNAQDMRMDFLSGPYPDNRVSAQACFALQLGTRSEIEIFELVTSSSLAL